MKQGTRVTGMWAQKWSAYNSAAKEDIQASEECMPGSTPRIDVTHSLGSAPVPVCRQLAIKALWH